MYNKMERVCVDHDQATGAMAFYDATGRHRNLEELDLTADDELYYLERYTPLPFMTPELGRETYEKTATRCVKVWANRLFAQSVARVGGRRVLYLDGPDLNTTKVMMAGPAVDLHVPNPFSYDQICAALASMPGATVTVSGVIHSECAGYQDVQLSAVFRVDRPDREPVTVTVYRQPVYVTLQMLRLRDIAFDGVWLDYTGTFEGAASKLHFPTYDLHHLFSARMLSAGATLMLTFSHRDGRVCRNTIPSVVHAMAVKHSYTVENACPVHMDPDMAVTECDRDRGLDYFNQTCEPIEGSEACRMPEPVQYPFGRYVNEEPLYDLTEATRQFAQAPAPVGFSYGTMTNFIFRVHTAQVENDAEEYTVERITKHRNDPDNGLLFETYWVGYADPTWQPEKDFWIDGIPNEVYQQYRKNHMYIDSGSESGKSDYRTESAFRVGARLATEMKRTRNRSRTRTRTRTRNRTRNQSVDGDGNGTGTDHRRKSRTKSRSRPKMYRVEGIVGHERSQDGTLWFLTKWVGYDTLTWQPESDFISRTGKNEQYLQYVNGKNLL